MRARDLQALGVIASRPITPPSGARRTKNNFGSSLFSVHSYSLAWVDPEFDDMPGDLTLDDLDLPTHEHWGRFPERPGRLARRKRDTAVTAFDRRPRWR